jgi:hypothetical protein
MVLQVVVQAVKVVQLVEQETLLPLVHLKEIMVEMIQDQEVLQEKAVEVVEVLQQSV